MEQKISNDPVIAAVLINYATEDDTLECVESLEKQTYPNLSIIVVDNCSPDGSGLRLKKKLNGRCTVILSEENLGFSYGNNLGLKAALQQGAEYVMYINSDTVQAPDLVSSLYMECKKGFVVTPKSLFYSEPDIIWDAGSSISRVGKVYNRGQGEKDVGQFDKIEPVEHFSGCCVMLPMESIEKAGTWDERFFLYWEDAEYSFRIKENGFEIHYVPEAKLWHKVSRSSGGINNPQTQYYSLRNRLWVMHNSHCPLICRGYTWLMAGMWWIRYRILGVQAFKYTWKAISDYYSGRLGKVDF